jgi:hypothetical protein
MKIGKRFLISLLLIFLYLIAAISNGQAQSGGGYDLTWNTLDSGGMGAASDSSYSLYGSIGQADANASLSGNGYSLVGGFWSGIPAYLISLPAVFKP